MSDTKNLKKILFLLSNMKYVFFQYSFSVSV